jgi:hypothetical protein
MIILGDSILLSMGPGAVGLLPGTPLFPRVGAQWLPQTGAVHDPRARGRASRGGLTRRVHLNLLRIVNIVVITMTS